MDTEWAGRQVRIEPERYPDFAVILFHVNLDASRTVGSTVRAGEPIGTHVGGQTASDIALSVNATRGYTLVSPFQAMTAAVFEAFRPHGINSLSDAVFTREQRDAAPLTCSGETFSGGESLPVFTAFR